MKILTVQLLPVAWPLENIFRTSLGQKKITRNVIVIVECDNGIKGYGEASSSLAMPETRGFGLMATLQKALPYVCGVELARWQDLADHLTKRFSDSPSAISALECALLDVYCRSKKISLRRYFGSQNNTIETDYTISALAPRACKAILKKRLKQGFKCFKIKAGGTRPNEDFERVRLMHSLAPKARLILDGNQCWEKRSALKFMDRLFSHDIPIEFVEQPLSKDDLEGLRELKKRSPFPIAVDESFRSLKDVIRIIELDAADVFNIKLAKTGLLEALRIADYVRKMNKKLMIGCMMESGIGLSTSIHWACATGIFDYVDLDSFLLLKSLNIQTGFSHEGPKIRVCEKVLGSGTIRSKAWYGTA